MYTFLINKESKLKSFRITYNRIIIAKKANVGTYSNEKTDERITKSRKGAVRKCFCQKIGIVEFLLLSLLSRGRFQGRFLLWATGVA